MNRKPVVAGQFYPAGRKSLEDEVRRFLSTESKPQNAIAAIVPHAGYIYSGSVAGAVFASVVVTEHVVVLSPNHTGMGARAAVWTSGSWQIPTGTIPVDEELSRDILKRSSELSDDMTAHISEHSLEVELPFLLERQPRLKIVPITVSHLNATTCKKIGAAIADAIKASKKDVLIVASTDMNHYEDQSSTLSKDNLAIEKLLNLDADGLLSTCGEHRISMCGVVPTAIAINAAKKLGAVKATLIKHATSGDVSGDYNAVVGYAGFIICSS